MATVDEILTRQAYAAGDGTWTRDNDYPSYTLYVEPEYVPVTNKRIADFNDQVSVRGEQNAQFVGFQLPRYDDGIDLTATHLYIHYQTVYGGSDSVPCNVSWSDNYVRMCWQVPAQATQEPDRVQMMIYATGTNSAGERVTWKTLPTSYTIHDGLDIGGGIPEPDPSWYEQFVAQMEAQVSTAQGHANDAQASKTAAAGSATAAAESAAASAQALEDNKAYVESQKETFVGYNRRETDTKYANALIGSASGTGRVTVGDAWEAPVSDMDISGRSEQFSTTGTQLLVYPYYNTTKTQNGITFTALDDGRVSIKGTVTGNNATYILQQNLILPPGTYTKNNPGTIKYMISRYLNGAFDRVEVSQNDGTFDTDGWDYDVYEYKPLLQTVTVGDTFDNLIVSPMLNAGATAKPWEPYTGGKPSPNPEYPQPIISTGTVSTGAQLLIPQITKVGVGVTATVTDDGKIRIKGTPSDDNNRDIYLLGNWNSAESYIPSGKYTLSCEHNGLLDTMYAISNASVIASTTSNVLTFAATDEKPLGAIMVHLKATAYDCTLAFMLNAGPTPKPWEPYTGGKPSPSPEYPQPLNVTMTGDNLLSIKNMNLTYNNLTLKVVDGIVQLVGTPSAVTVMYYAGGYEETEILFTLPAGKHFISDCRIISYDGQNRRIVTGAVDFAEPFNVTAILSENYSANVAINKTLYPMINQGDTALPWQPYQSCTASITLTEPLRGIGDTQDRIMCKDGVWGIERYISHYKLTSDIVSASSGGVTTTNNIIDNRYTVITCEAWKNIIKKELYENGKKTIGFCTIAPPGMINDWNTSKNGKENVYTINAAGAMYISIPISSLGITADATRAEVTAAVKQYVADNDVYVMFILDSPTWEPLPSATQSALNALTTYKGVTHVTITAGGPEPDVGLGYVQDTRVVIADLQAQINEIRNGGTI